MAERKPNNNKNSRRNDDDYNPRFRKNEKKGMPFMCR